MFVPIRVQHLVSDLRGRDYAVEKDKHREWDNSAKHRFKEFGQDPEGAFETLKSSFVTYLKYPNMYNIYPYNYEKNI